MKTNQPACLLLAIAFICSSLISNSQLPRHWARTYGGSGVDIATSIKATTDGGSIVVGYTDSKNGDVSQHASREYWDLWVLKLDACGTKLWERSFGGRGYDAARDVIQLSDGGYFILGETNSVDGDVTAGYGASKDIWLIRISNTGNLVWQKRYGGSGIDIGNQIKHLNDGNFLIASSTSSTDGNFIGSHGYTDGGLLKIGPDGSIIWSKCFGGSKNDELLAIEEINGRIYIAGYANSVDGDIPPTQKNYDVWLLALDNNGAKVFSKIYGGSQNDVAYSMTRSSNGSLCLAGYTTSTDGDVTQARGGQDYWVINVAATGKLNWQRTLGGAKADYANAIIADGSNGYLVGGTSYSTNQDVTTSYGDGDFWLVRLDANGTKTWEKSFGGTKADNLRSLAKAVNAEEYLLAGDAESRDRDFTFNRGDADLAVIKLKLPRTIVSDTLVCDPARFPALTDTLRDACGFDSVFRTYKPLPVSPPLTGFALADTIFEGETVRLPGPDAGNLLWQGNGLSCNSCTHPSVTPGQTSTYTLIQQLTGCTQQSRFTVVVLRDAMVEIPTGFTPNGDGLNDYFGPIGKVPAAYQLQVINRYGEIVFKSSSMHAKWNGYYKNSLQPTGAFIYLIQYNNREGQPILRKGTVMLIR